jgi:hypothetical protein
VVYVRNQSAGRRGQGLGERKPPDGEGEEEEKGKANTFCDGHYDAGRHHNQAPRCA